MGAWFYDGSADMRADESVVLRSERPPATLPALRAGERL